MRDSDSSHRVLLTGATGFVGSQVLRVLQDAGYRCRVVVRQPKDLVAPLATKTEVLEGDLLDESRHSAWVDGCTHVVHAAAYLHQRRAIDDEQRELYHRVNTVATLSLAQQALSRGVARFVFLSSVKVMGELAGRGVPCAENVPPAPTDAYGSSKLAAEAGLKSLFTAQAGTSCVTLRLPMVYGPGAKGNPLLMMRAARRGLRLPIANVTSLRSMAYVGNISSAVRAVLDRKPSVAPFAAYFLTDGVDYTSREFYDNIFHSMHPGGSGTFGCPFLFLKLASLVPGMGSALSRLTESYRFSSDRFQADYDWSAPYTLAQGVTEMVGEYLRRHEASA